MASATACYTYKLLYCISDRAGNQQYGSSKGIATTQLMNTYHPGVRAWACASEIKCLIEKST